MNTRSWFIAVIAAALVIVGSAGAAALLTGADIKDGSLGKKEFKDEVQRSLPIRVSAELPDQGFEATNATVTNTPDGVEFGPYAAGGAAGGSVCTDLWNGRTLGSVAHIAYVARYTADGDTGGVGAPYLRIFLENDQHDAIFSPNTQPPDPDIQEGPFHTWVATAGLWRYDDDAGSGGEYGLNGAPFSQLQADHGAEVINAVCITTGSSAGTNLSALLRAWELDSSDYAFGR
jgi:hypothetical protein